MGGTLTIGQKVLIFLVFIVLLFLPIVIAIFFALLAILALLIDMRTSRPQRGLRKENANAASVVIWIILAIGVLLIVLVLSGVIAGIYASVGALSGGVTCVSNPIDEMVTKLKKAQSGITTSTGIICMYTGESYIATSLTNKVTNLEGLTFECDSAAVCKNNRPIDVSSSNMIKAVANAQFKAIISCTEDYGDYNCTITIRSA